MNTRPRSQASAAAAQANRKQALQKIQQAQSLISDAAQLTCPLGGFIKPYQKICRFYDQTKALWHSVNNAPPPTYHDEVD